MDEHDSRLRPAIRHAYDHSAEVRERFDAAGIGPADVQRVADLEKVPVLAKDAVIARQQADPPFGGLLAAPLSQVRRIFLSPGPIYEPDAADDLQAAIAVAQEAFRWAGFGPGDVVLNCLSYHLVPAGMLVDRALAEMGATVVPGGVGNSELQLKLMADLGVTAYAGTPSFLLQLIRKAEEMGRDFRRDFKLKKLFATAEPFPASLRQTFVEGYGLAAANCYATAELGFLALDTAGQLALRLLPEPIIQVVDPDTGRSVGPGEAGEVVVTNFSRGYPLIRLGTGDLAVNVDPRPGVSRQDERAIILVGRRGEAVKVRGMFVHPNQLRFAVAQVAPGAAVQGLVSRPGGRDHFRLRVALAAADAGAAERIKAAVRDLCRVGVDEVELVPAEDLPAGAPGMLDQREWG
ncbi:MAG: phenylacetate--CoA ligase family protein [Candidatus Promineifilaceae bacterium]